MAGNRVISAVLTLKDKDFGRTVKESASAMKDLERKTQHSGNAIKSFGKSATSSFKSVALGAGSILTAIGAAKLLSGAFNMVKGSIGSAFDRIDVMEKFERTMTTLTGSTDKAKAALESTREAVTGTAYGLDTAAQSVQNFVTRGMEVDKATETMKIWGDAVAFYGDGSNEQLETVSDALGKMYSSGKVGMDQMNRLFDSGIDGVGMFAQATGRDVASVQKDLSSGKISAEEFVDTVSLAMEEGTNGVQKIAGTAKEAGASWSGSFANMRAAVTRGVEDIIMNIDRMLVENGLPDMRSMVSEFGKKFETTLKSAGEYVEPFVGVVVGMYDRIKPGIDWLKDTAFPGIKDELVGMYESAQPALSWIGETGIPLIVDAVVLAVDGFTGLYNFVKEHLPILTPVIAGVAASVLAFKLGVVLMSTAMGIWKGVTTAITIATAILNGTLALSPFGWVVIAIGAVVAIGIVLYKNWDTIREKAGKLWEKTKEVFGGIYDWGVNKIQPVIEFFKSLGDKFNDFKTAISNFSLPGWVNTIGSTLSNAASRVGNFFGGPEESYAVGTNRVPHDMVAQIHKDEMIIPATQSQKLRKQGVTIDNIDKGRPASAQARTAQYISQPNNATNSELPQLIQALMKLIQMLSNMPKGDVNININGHNLTVDQIVGELVRKLESVNFNMA